jgi:ABC-type uncharacterized transport system fused permease/ATPase subunit
MNSPAGAFVSLWDNLRDNYCRLFVNFMSLNAWLTAVEQYIAIVPYLVAAPLLFAPAPDTITLGTLVQLSNSFGKVFSGLNIVADNWGSINEFCSCVVRLKQFENSVNRWVSSAETSRRNNKGDAILVARGAPRSHDPDLPAALGGVELKHDNLCFPEHSDDSHRV